MNHRESGFCQSYFTPSVFIVFVTCIFVTVQCFRPPFLDFERAKDKKIGPELNKLLSHIAKTGRTEYDDYIKFLDNIKHLLNTTHIKFFMNVQTSLSNYLYLNDRIPPCRFPWPLLKPLIAYKLERVCFWKQCIYIK